MTTASGSLAGLNIVVTGGAQGIGAATVRAYVAAGATVAALDINAADGDEVAATASRSGPGQARFHYCDVANRRSVEATFHAIGMPRIDILANVAGVERSVFAETSRTTTGT